MKNYNLNLIRKRHCYSIKEICSLLGVCKVTIKNWQQKGFLGIDERKTNKLFYGEILISFLRNLMQSRRVTLKVDEFYCLACHKAVNGTPKTYQKTQTGKNLGFYAKQVIISSKCEFCGNKLRKFSSTSCNEISRMKKKIKTTNEEIKGEQLVLPKFLSQDTIK
jgi:MerR HTH family regulatory protein